MRRVTAEERKRLEDEEGAEILIDKLVDSFLGFSKLMRHVSKSGKPLVGHNCLLDLIKIYHQFFKKLPKYYKEFKKEIHKVFPVIFDTKNICLFIPISHFGLLATPIFILLYIIFTTATKTHILSRIPFSLPFVY
mgnify:CR=1 FL=1